MRLNCLDHYQTIPTIYDPQLQRFHDKAQQKELSKVPVIRVFGATESGQKVCAHIHGAFPYLYIPYDGDLKQQEGKDASLELGLLLMTS